MICLLMRFSSTMMVLPVQGIHTHSHKIIHMRHCKVTFNKCVVSIWCGIVGNCLCVLHFIRECLTAASSWEWIQLYLENVPLQTRLSVDTTHFGRAYRVPECKLSRKIGRMRWTSCMARYCQIWPCWTSLWDLNDM
jgi:hypothetical protein